MSIPGSYPKPDLSRLSSRQMQISTNRQTLEWDLHEWVTEVVRHTKQPPENGLRPETILMATAKDSIDVLMQAAPTAMALGGSGRKQTVHAQFHWGQFPNGHWYVSAVSFGLDVSAAQMQLARQRAIKQRLLDQAEVRNSGHIHPCISLRDTSTTSP